MRSTCRRQTVPDDWDLDDFAPPTGRAASVERPAARRPIAAAGARPKVRPSLCRTPAAARRRQETCWRPFFSGAGMEDVALADPVETMERLGAAFRAMVSGIRHALIARSEVKREFRIEATIIRSRGNNLLKFSANDDDALAGLLGAGRRTDMGAEEAVTDALTDIRLHELATMTAMQSAVRALVMRLGPDQIRDGKEQWRPARCWATARHAPGTLTRRCMRKSCVVWPTISTVCSASGSPSLTNRRCRNFCQAKEPRRRPAMTVRLVAAVGLLAAFDTDSYGLRRLGPPPPPPPPVLELTVSGSAD